MKFRLSSKSPKRKSRKLLCPAQPATRNKSKFDPRAQTQVRKGQGARSCGAARCRDQSPAQSSSSNPRVGYDGGKTTPGCTLRAATGEWPRRNRAVPSFAVAPHRGFYVLSQSSMATITTVSHSVPALLGFKTTDLTQLLPSPPFAGASCPCQRMAVSHLSQTHELPYNAKSLN